MNKIFDFSMTFHIRANNPTNQALSIDGVGPYKMMKPKKEVMPFI